MTTIPSVSPGGYGYSTPVTGTGDTVSQKPGAKAQPANLPSLENSLVSLGGNPTSPLTYNAAGLLNSFQQAASAKPATATTSMQAAKQAILTAENAVTEALNSLTSGSSPNSSASDNSALFSLPGTIATNNQLGLAQGLLSKPANTPASGSTSAQTAQQAVIAVENAITETLNSLTSGSSPNSPRSGA